MLKPIPIAPSSHIEAMSYDEETMELYVQFKRSGQIFKYKGVPEDVVNDLSRSLSAGQHFEAFIRDAGFEFEKLT